MSGEEDIQLGSNVKTMAKTAAMVTSFLFSKPSQVLIVVSF